MKILKVTLEVEVDENEVAGFNIVPIPRKGGDVEGQSSDGDDEVEGQSHCGWNCSNGVSLQSSEY